jgi:NAD(P)-dependent dehydrogenase (short-subunit alcohol dehydrogenase family)
MAETTGGVVLVTGASGALGGAVVARQADNGRRVVALERSKNGDESLEEDGQGVLRLHAKTSDAQALTSAMSRAEAKVGALSGAVLTAGAWRGGQPFHEAAALADWRTVMDANLETAQLTLRAILPGMVQRGRGSIVLVGSRSGVRPYDAPGDAAYAASKAALAALAQAIAAEVVTHGVRLNLVLPSTIDTEANRKAMPDADHSRWVTTDSLCDVIDFLLSERSRDISGALLPVYGRGGV